MKELREIVTAFEDAERRGLKTALATVVHVVGSAYRHEGARMLICENGEFTGAISGGCLEGDALRKARLCIAENRNMLVTYDTTDEDDATLGVGLGCNGIIQVLLEPIDANKPFNPIQLFKNFLSKRQEAVLGTFFSLDSKQALQPGTSVLVTAEGLSGNISDTSIESEFLWDAEQVLTTQNSIIKYYQGQGSYTAFVEHLKPPVQLLVFGAGNDAIPLVQFAAILGWEVSVIDGRTNYANTRRFVSANRIVVSKADTALSNIKTDDWTVAVLMTHNYIYDITVLEQLLSHNVKYIGALGPKKKLLRMIDELKSGGTVITPKQLNLIYGPTGLDIGSETPEEIALSIIAEIKAVLSGRDGSSLRLKVAAPEVAVTPLKKHAQAKFTSCAVDL